MMADYGLLVADRFAFSRRAVIINMIFKVNNN